MWCNASRESHESTTFVYLGSDVDMTLLHLLQPFETRVIYWDNFGPINYDYGAWDSAHANDTRLSYRQTTQSMRPLNASSSAERMRLGNLAYRRLLDEQNANLTSVQRVAPLLFQFMLHGIRRKLSFLFYSVVHENNIVRFRLKKQVSAVSTIATPGFWAGGDVVRTLIELTTHALHAEALRARPLRILDADNSELFVKLGEAGIYRSFVDVRRSSLGRVNASSWSDAEGAPARLGGNTPLAAVCLYHPLQKWENLLAWHLMRPKPTVTNMLINGNQWEDLLVLRYKEDHRGVYLHPDADLVMMYVLLLTTALWLSSYVRVRRCLRGR